MSFAEAIEVFTFIFIAALPGRTTFVMILMAAKARPLAVFLGSSLAFVIQSAIAVALGSLLSLVPRIYIDIGAGLLFIIFGIIAWREQAPTMDQVKFAKNEKSLPVIRRAFFLVFAMEWGDVSQLAIASAAAQKPQQLMVLPCAIMAMILTALIATFVGSHSKRFLPPKVIQKVSAGVFVGVGLFFLARAVNFL